MHVFAILAPGACRTHLTHSALGQDELVTDAPQDRAVRRVWSPWPIVGAALGWLVVLAVLVRHVTLMLQLWIISVVTVVAVIGYMTRVRQAREGADKSGEHSYPLAGQDPSAPASPAQNSMDEAPGPQLSAVADGQGDMYVTLDQALQTLTVAEVAAVLRVPASAVVTEIREGRMPGNEINGEWRIRSVALIRWLDGAYGEHKDIPRPRRRRTPPRPDRSGRS